MSASSQTAMPNPAGSGSGEGARFDDLALRAARRLEKRDFLKALRASALPVFVPAALALVILRWSGIAVPELPIVIGLVMAWLAACALAARLGRASPFAALAHWDDAVGRGEMMASAWFFEHEGRGRALRDGERLHLRRAGDELPAAEARLRGDLPLPRLTWQPLLPVLLAAFTLTSWFVPPPLPGEELLSDAMQETARAEADELARRSGELEKMSGLSAEEREAVDELREALASVADELGEAGDRSANEVLEALEERARAAERLASELGDAGDAWASEKMIAEMRRHADTADLAEGVADKDAARSAEESEKIADRLEDEQLTTEVQDRVDGALDRIVEEATDEDRERLVGKHVEEASEQMQRRDPKAASSEFDELAKAFRKIEERERAQEQLEALAEQLREAGANIAGQNAEGMEKLAGANQGSSAPGAATPMQPNQGAAGQQPNAQPISMQNLASSPMPVPGLSPSPAPPGATPGQMLAAPVPGTQPPGSGQPMALVPGSGAPQPGQPGVLLPAPIPGTQPGGQAAFAVPGAGGQPGGAAALGGLQAGTGTSAPQGDATEAAAAARQGTVSAQVNADGESAVRAVQGGTREELATRSRQEVAVDFLNSEEDALDEQPLPLSRREHVRRYFNALRQQFEASAEAAGGSPE